MRMHTFIAGDSNTRDWLMGVGDIVESLLPAMVRLGVATAEEVELGRITRAAYATCMVFGVFVDESEERFCLEDVQNIVHDGKVDREAAWSLSPRTMSA